MSRARIRCPAPRRARRLPVDSACSTCLIDPAVLALVSASVCLYLDYLAAPPHRQIGRRCSCPWRLPVRQRRRDSRRTATGRCGVGWERSGTLSARAIPATPHERSVRAAYRGVSGALDERTNEPAAAASDHCSPQFAVKRTQRRRERRWRQPISERSLQRRQTSAHPRARHSKRGGRMIPKDNAQLALRSRPKLRSVGSQTG